MLCSRPFASFGFVYHQAINELSYGWPSICHRRYRCNFQNRNRRARPRYRAKGKYDANNYEYRIGNKANQRPFADGMRTARLLILPNKVEDQANNGEEEGEHMKACAGAILLLWIGLLAIGVLIVWGVIGLLLALVGLLRARGRCRRGNGSAASRTNNGIVRQRSTTISAIHKYAPFIFQYLNDMKENLFACIIACVKRKFNRISVEQNITC